MVKSLSYIDDVPHYKSGASTALVRDKSVPVFKLSSNESVFGASPRAVERGRAWLERGRSHLYSSGDCASLRDALGRRHGVDGEQIVCGNGSDELIAMLVRAYCGVGDDVVMSRYGFIYYRIAVRSVGATPVFADVGEDFEETSDAFLRACSRRTKMIFIANPNNPTGYLWREGALASLLERLPEDILLVIDAAYAEYACGEAGYEDGMGLVSSGRCVMLRTFSKLYGLSALRIGWGFMPLAVKEALEKIRPPFNVNAMAQEMALGALEDKDFYDDVCRKTLRGRGVLYEAMSRLNGVKVYKSAGNFLLLRFVDGETACGMVRYLSEHGVIVRPLEDYGLADCVRVSVGDGDGQRAVLRLLGHHF